jgi:endonuclease G
MKTLLLSLLVTVNQFVFCQMELPKIGVNDIVVHHSSYSLIFNQKHRQANWIAYCLTRTETNAIYKRDNQFIADPLIPGTNLRLDYQKSGYDRGHLVPAGDMGFSKIAMEESFYYSNMSPQVPQFNRGIWKTLETQVRNWAFEYDSLYVVTGPIFSDSMKVIGPHRVAVPNYYYKVILDNHKGKEKMIGFVLKNAGSSNALQSFAVSVDSIEVLSGIDFFPLLEDSLETKLESLILVDSWKWKFVKKKK